MVRHQAEGPSQRQLRVAEEVRHVLAQVFERGDFRDPDLATARITVTEVRASPDLKHMTAFISGLGKDVAPAQFAALRRAAPDLRHEVAKVMRLRYAPDIHFQPDTALDYAMHISQVMYNNPVVQRDLAARLDENEPEAGEPKDDEA